MKRSKRNAEQTKTPTAKALSRPRGATRGEGGALRAAAAAAMMAICGGPAAAAAGDSGGAFPGASMDSAARGGAGGSASSAPAAKAGQETAFSETAGGAGPEAGTAQPTAAADPEAGGAAGEPRHGFAAGVQKAGEAVKKAAIDVKNRSVNTWDNGRWDLYVPFYSWHPAWAYSEEKRQEFNSWPWGGGVGKSWEDASGHEDLVYAMAFLDSHSHVEPVVGYARQWFTRPLAGGLKLGGGYMVGVTSRADVMSNVPFPLALPVVSAKAGAFSVMSAIVPGSKGIRAALVWARIELGAKKTEGGSQAGLN